MLPTHQPRLSRYIVQSTDVISDMRVNVAEESSGRILWYKERFLTDDEIVEHIVNNLTNTVRWTIHRPKRGWYIRIRSPSFPPGVHVGLMPVPRTSPYYTNAALCFACQTTPSNPEPSKSRQSVITSPPQSSKSSLESDVSLDGPRSPPSVHSYPPTPTPPAVIVEPPSPRSVHAKLDGLDSTSSRTLKDKGKRKLTQVTQFLLAPSIAPQVPQASAEVEQSKKWFWQRALSAFTSSSDPTYSSSFTICTMPPPSRTPRPPPPQTSSFDVAGSTTQLTSSPAPDVQEPEPQPLTPLVTFHDQTSAFTIHASTGLLEIDESAARALGVEQSFWVVIALTYLEFLEDRDSYLAAIND